MLWATLPLVLAPILEWVAFGTDHLLNFINYRVNGIWRHARARRHHRSVAEHRAGARVATALEALNFARAPSRASTCGSGSWSPRRCCSSPPSASARLPRRHLRTARPARDRGGSVELPQRRLRCLIPATTCAATVRGGTQRSCSTRRLADAIDLGAQRSSPLERQGTRTSSRCTSCSTRSPRASEDLDRHHRRAHHRARRPCLSAPSLQAIDPASARRCSNREDIAEGARACRCAVGGARGLRCEATGRDRDCRPLGDADTADLFTGISRETDKYLWFLEAHLHAKR